MNNKNSGHPLVSIIVPSYNHEKFVKKTLQSIFNQTYKYIEIIIIDDCSTDSTAEIIQEELNVFQGTHTFIRKEKNKGVSDSLRQGIMISKGDYVLPFSSDDMLTPEAVQERVDFMENHKEYTFIHTDAQFIDDDGRPAQESSDPTLKKEGDELRKNYIRFKNSNEQDLLKYMMSNGNVVIGCTTMWRKEANALACSYDDNLSLCQDYDIWLRAAVKYQWGYLDKPTALYRLHSNNSYKVIKPDEIYRKYISQFSIMFAKLYDEIIQLADTSYRKELLKILLPYAYYYWFNDSNEEYEKKARGVLFKKFDRKYAWHDNYSLTFRIRAVIRALTGIDIKDLRKKISVLLKGL